MPSVVPQGYGRLVTGSAAVPQPIVDRNHPPRAPPISLGINRAPLDQKRCVVHSCAADASLQIRVRFLVDDRALSTLHAKVFGANVEG